MATINKGTPKKNTASDKRKASDKKVLQNDHTMQNEAEDMTPVAAEPMVEYAMPLSSAAAISNFVILHDAAAKPESRMTPFEKIGLIREGISKKDLEHLKEKADLDYNQLSKVLSVARATLINKKGKEKFDMALSEKIVGVADIYSYGYEVFEDENRFNDWIFRSNLSLGGQSPYDLLDSQYGREEVKNLIGRIDYGVYS